MMGALSELYRQAGERFLMITGVRLGESAARDQRIALSCSKDSGECGQGWYQKETPGALADTLAPLLHWRVCHIFDWLYFDDRHGYDVDGIAAIYGEEEIRTGCIACNVASKDTSLLRLIKQPGWEHLRPLLELRPLYQELSQAKNRKRKAGLEMQADGKYSKKTQRLGPLVMEARAYGLERVLDIQRRAGVDLINPEEEARIREMWALDIWPEKWSAGDISATIPLDAITLDEMGRPIVQALLVK
jgi:DNA sulfur modification protein DndC